MFIFKTFYITSYQIYICHPQLKLKHKKKLTDDVRALPDESSEKD